MPNIGIWESFGQNFTYRDSTPVQELRLDIRYGSKTPAPLPEFAHSIRNLHSPKIGEKIRIIVCIFVSALE